MENKKETPPNLKPFPEAFARNLKLGNASSARFQENIRVWQCIFR
jgi:hypothetical protein